MSNGINSENNILLKTFFSGHFDIVPETILIIVGTWIGAERYDRTLAMLIKKILFELNIESDIITDIYYYEKIDKFCKNHIICIGSRISNKITKDYEEKFGLNLNETTTKIFDEDDRQIAFVYGRGVKETYEATINFCEEHLKSFLDNWSNKYTKNKRIKIQTNLEDLLKSIIYSPSETVSNKSLKGLKNDKLNNSIGLKIESELNKYRFYLVISISFSMAMLVWITLFLSSADFWVSLGVSLAVLFGIPTMYSIYPRKSDS